MNGVPIDEFERYHFPFDIKSAEKLDGGMADAYALSTSVGDVIVKAIADRIASSREFKHRFRQEIRVNQLLAPLCNVPRVYCYGDAPKLWYAMQMLKGSTLANADTSVTLQAFGDFLNVLRIAESNHITHRDISPDNLFFTQDGRGYVIDWGLAYVAGSVGTYWPRRLTSADRQHGTSPFLPPEQTLALYDSPDVRNDVFSLAVVLSVYLLNRPEDLLNRLSDAPSATTAIILNLLKHKLNLPETLIDRFAVLLSQSKAARGTIKAFEEMLTELRDYGLE